MRTDTAKVETSSPRKTVWRFVMDLRVQALTTWVLLAIAVTLDAILQPTFFTLYSITSNFATFVPLVLVAIAQTIVVVGGGLDLSLGAVVALSSVLAVTIMGGRGDRIGLGFLVAVGAGAACGLANGLIVSVVRLQPLIATLATASIFSGLTLVVLPKPGGNVPAVMTEAYRMAVAGIPVSVLAVVVAVALWLLLTRTKLMRHIYAVGGDPAAAYASLVPVTRVRTASYVLAGAFSGLAAMALLANSGSGDPFVGADIALNSIAAVVVGGVALRGGRGGAIGAVVGAIVLAIASNVLFFFNVPTTYRQLANGLVIISALALSVLSPGKGAKR
ncbi:MAG TPA: ABC transporter permease [Coriobacteriia bacterium]|jgi:ribose transport system permease protein